jgi:D-alanyl-D-alanine-carboxypeptidase/D-alanyl-D-alanine-endopeptidase
MRVRIMFAAALIAVMAVPEIAPAQTLPETESPIRAQAKELDAIFERYLAKTPTPGLVYGIVAEGRLVHVRGFGVQDLDARRPVTADSLFRIASMTKAFTALAILSLRDAGKLSLDDLAEKHVPEMRGWKYPTADSPRIRIRDLLSHTAGFVTDDPWGDRQTPLPEVEFTRMLAAGVPFSRPPQTQHEYSNFGYALLGRIVANVSGLPYRSYVERTILKPLGMTSSGFEVGEAPRERRALGYRWEDDRWSEEPTMAHGAFGAMGGLQVSANDYAKWVAFLLSAWPPRDGPETGPVRRASVRELAEGSNYLSTRPRLGTLGGECIQAQAYGKGFRVSQDCELGLMLHHGGGYPGYGSHLLLVPQGRVGIFVFTNRTYTGAADAAWDAAFLLAHKHALPSPARPVSDALVKAQDTARAIYAAGAVAGARDALAMNFLMDRSAESWRLELARIRAQLGTCPTAEPMFATGALSTAFRWNCERGKLDGNILLAPTNPPTIQALRFFPQPAR